MQVVYMLIVRNIPLFCPYVPSKNTFPYMHFHLTSGDTEQVTEKPDNG